MPAKRSDEEIIRIVEEAYEKMINSERLSLSAVATQIGVDRKILGRYIESYIDINFEEKALSKDQIDLLRERISNNCRRNGDGTSRIGKKEKSLATQEYQDKIAILVEKGVTLEDVEDIYCVLQKDRKHTGMVKDTIVNKLGEFIIFFEQRGISKDQLIDMIKRRPRFFTHDINGTIKSICEELDRINHYNTEATNERIINNPGIFCTFKIEKKGTTDTPPIGGDDR